MATKRIKMVRSDILTGKIRLLHDDGSQGEISIDDAKAPLPGFNTLTGLTLKQAKILLGVKN